MKHLVLSSIWPVNGWTQSIASTSTMRCVNWSGPKIGGGNAFLQKLIDASSPKPINVRALPARSRDLPDEARRMLSEHASWLRARGDTNNTMEELT